MYAIEMDDEYREEQIRKRWAGQRQIFSLIWMVVGRWPVGGKQQDDELHNNDILDQNQHGG